WSPILPVMLVFAVDAIRRFSGFERRLRRLVPAAALILLSLLFLLSVEEIGLRLKYYQRRINYVSEALALAAAAVEKESPDPKSPIVVVAGDDEHFVFAWYFSQTTHHSPFLSSPLPHWPLPNGPRESLDDCLLGCFRGIDEGCYNRLFVIRYFTE